MYLCPCPCMYRCQLPRPRERTGEKIKGEAGPRRLLTRRKRKKKQAILYYYIFIIAHAQRDGSVYFVYGVCPACPYTGTYIFSPPLLGYEATFGAPFPFLFSLLPRPHFRILSNSSCSWTLPSSMTPAKTLSALRPLEPCVLAAAPRSCKSREHCRKSSDGALPSPSPS